jgi:ubiquinone/menaquinone biosynthesis C-methylase UbiE
MDSWNFTPDTVYLEIGCGPANIGTYLSEKSGCPFIGVDFNYNSLVVLNEYFKEKGIENYILIHSDINDMPIIDGVVDYIYGGGVIEHTEDTITATKELYRVLSAGGVSFNTVPAYNLFWLLRFFYSIPSIEPIKSVLAYIHLKVLKGLILNKFYGFELSFTEKNISNLHKKAGFNNIKTGSFAFHPSKNKIHSQKIRELFYKISNIKIFCPFYYVKASK